MTRLTGDIHGSHGGLQASAMRAGNGKLPAVLLVGYFFTKPFYIFPSGGPQIADGLIAMLFFWGIFSGSRPSRETFGVLNSALLFSAYTLVINGIWAMILADPSMLKTPIFYFFNTVTIFIVLSLHARDRDSALRILTTGIVLSLAIQSVLSVALLGMGSSRRSDLFFNNPNQLGYWGLLSVSIFCVLTRMVRIRMVWQIAVFLMGFYLVALSLGKAATLSLGILFVLHFSKKWWHFVLAVICGGIVLMVLQNQPILQDLATRLATIGHQQDDSLAGRGYTRIWNHPEYLLFGAGEYGLVRFPGEDRELHSTLGTLLFSYGAVGFSLFAMIMLRLLRRAGLSNFLYLAPAFAYGLTHQGLRFSLLWILMAVVALAGRQRDAGDQPQNDDPMHDSPNDNGGRSIWADRPPS